jgi:hypothetical protein
MPRHRGCPGLGIGGEKSSDQPLTRITMVTRMQAQRRSALRDPPPIESSMFTRGGLSSVSHDSAIVSVLASTIHNRAVGQHQDGGSHRKFTVDLLSLNRAVPLLLDAAGPNLHDDFSGATASMNGNPIKRKNGRRRSLHC